MNVFLYKIAKSPNSTKQPLATTLKQCYGSFKQGTNITAPAVEIYPTSDTGNPYAYNGLYIPDFHRYYFIRNWSYDKGVWTAETAVDLLASAKGEITDMSAYVSRSVTLWDGNISDAAYATKISDQMRYTSVAAGFNPTGTFIVGVSGDSHGGSTGGGTNYYCLSPGEMNAFMQELFSSTSYTGIADTDLFYYNPFQYLVSCKWYPFTITSEIERPIKLGFKSLSLAAAEAPVAFALPDKELNAPNHPDIERGLYLNAAPYASYRLYLAGAGEIEISGNALSKTDRKIIINAILDVIDGLIVYNVYNSNTLLTRVEGHIGADIAVSQVTTSQKGMMMETAMNLLAPIAEKATEAAAGITAGIPFVSDITRQLSSNFDQYYDGAKNTLRQASITGSDGNRACFYTTPNHVLFSQFTRLCAEDLAHRGRPLKATAALTALSGYVQTENVHFESQNFLPTECNEIEMFMNGGFYIE